MPPTLSPTVLYLLNIPFVPAWLWCSRNYGVRLVGALRGAPRGMSVRQAPLWEERCLQPWAPGLLQHSEGFLGQQLRTVRPAREAVTPRLSLSRGGSAYRTWEARMAIVEPSSVCTLLGCPAGGGRRPWLPEVPPSCGRPSHGGVSTASPGIKGSSAEWESVV